MPLFYVVLNARDSIKFPNPSLVPPDLKGRRFALAVQADDEDEARDLIQASFAELSNEKDFGELYAATLQPYGWILPLPPD